MLKEYGSSLRREGKYDAALATFKRARKVMPANAQLMDLITATERVMEERGIPAAAEPIPPTPVSAPVSPPVALTPRRPPAKTPVRAVPVAILPAPSTTPIPAAAATTGWANWLERWRSQAGDPWALTAIVLLLAVATFRWQIRLLHKEVARLSWEAEDRRTEASRLRDEVRGREQALKVAEGRTAAADDARHKAEESLKQAGLQFARLSAHMDDTRAALAREESVHRDEVTGLREALALLRSSVQGIATSKGGSAAASASFRREQAVLASLVVDVPGAEVEAARERAASQARALYALNPAKALAFFQNLAGGSSAGARRTAAWIAGAIPLDQTLLLLERLAQDPDALVAREGLKTLKQIAEASGPAGAWPPALRPRAGEALAKARSTGEWVV